MRVLRIWIDTRWFIKHWQVSRATARYFAVQRANAARKARP